MLLVLAPVQMLAAEQNYDDHFKGLLSKCWFFSSGMVTILASSISNIQKKSEPKYSQWNLIHIGNVNPPGLLWDADQQNAAKPDICNTNLSCTTINNLKYHKI